MKKLNSLQHFVNNIWFKKTWTNCSIIKTVVCPGFFESDVISTDSQSPVIKIFKTGLIYAYIYWPISKFNQQSNFFQPKNRFFWKNWYWVAMAIDYFEPIPGFDFEWFAGPQDAVFNCLRVQYAHVREQKKRYVIHL